MRCAIIINYFLVQKAEVENLVLSSNEVPLA